MRTGTKVLFVLTLKQHLGYALYCRVIGSVVHLRMEATHARSMRNTRSCSTLAKHKS